MWILTKNTRTGKIASVPENLLAVFPDLEVVEEEEPCTDCIVQLEEPLIEPEQEEVVELQEPAPRKRK